jgi:hypothetical protein
LISVSVMAAAGPGVVSVEPFSTLDSRDRWQPGRRGVAWGAELCRTRRGGSTINRQLHPRCFVENKIGICSRMEFVKTWGRLAVGRGAVAVLQGWWRTGVPRMDGYGRSGP